jgi:hypothetical protein
MACKIGYTKKEGRCMKMRLDPDQRRMRNNLANALAFGNVLPDELNDAYSLGVITKEEFETIKLDKCVDACGDGVGDEVLQDYRSNLMEMMRV